MDTIAALDYIYFRSTPIGGGLHVPSKSTINV